jgi:hypothetical protein
MESHEGPFFVTPPCYILAVEGYAVDPTSGEAVYDENLQFLTQGVGPTDEPAVVLFTERHLAEEYLAHMDEQFGLRPLEIPNNDAFKRFLRLATSVYRIASIDPDPKTGMMAAGLMIEDMLQNVDFPGVTGV